MSLIKETQAFCTPNAARAWTEFAISFGLLLAAFACVLLLSGALWAVVLGGLLYTVAGLRFYAIGHDCGHYSYFSKRWLNDAVGHLCGLFTGNVHAVMQYSHNLHHQHLGNLDHRDVHEILTLTVQEYEDAPWLKRLHYRIYRHPLAMYTLGPLYVNLWINRFPRNACKIGVHHVILHHSAMAVFWIALYALGGWAMIAVVLIGFFLGAAIGIFTTYIGHNFETTYWQATGAHNQRQAALEGASVTELGPVFDFMLLNFGYHDLHHLNARIPCYRLRDCHRALTGARDCKVITVAEGLRCLKWRLWDEDQGRMVGFRQSFVDDLMPLASQATRSEAG